MAWDVQPPPRRSVSPSSSRSSLPVPPFPVPRGPFADQGSGSVSGVQSGVWDRPLVFGVLCRWRRGTLDRIVEGRGEKSVPRREAGGPTWKFEGKWHGAMGPPRYFFSWEFGIAWYFFASLVLLTRFSRFGRGADRKEVGDAVAEDSAGVVVCFRRVLDESKQNNHIIGEMAAACDTSTGHLCPEDMVAVQAAAVGIDHDDCFDSGRRRRWRYT